MKESVGQQLRAAREGRGMSVSEVAAETLIPSGTIAAIEQDDFDSIPAPLYARGFIKLYAACVGLSPAPLLRAYDIARAEASAGRRQKQQPTPRKSARPKRAAAPSEPARKKPVRVRPRLHIRLPKLRRPDFSFSALASQMRDLAATYLKSCISAAKSARAGLARAAAAIRALVASAARKARTLKPRRRLSAEAAQSVFLSTVAVALVVLIALGICWHRNNSKPRRYSSRFFKERPEPYIEQAGGAEKR